MIVAKFGGTSMADAECIKKACAIMLSNPNRKIMVVSAPGKRFKNDTKLTDLLISLSQSSPNSQPANQSLAQVLDRFNQIANDLGLDKSIGISIGDDIKSRLLKAKSLSQNRFFDLIKAAGEDNCARIVAAYLNKIGATAQYVNPCKAGLILSNRGHVLPQSYIRLSKLKDYNGISVFSGFFGSNEEGEVVTFSRGGSDVTGSVLAAAVNAQIYENFTDVDSVYVADPKIINNPLPIKEITYRQIRELAYAGFNVFHEEAVEPVVSARIPIHIKNTFNPSAEGTKIVFSKEESQGGVVAIAGTGGFCNLTISKFLMNKEIGFGRRLFQILEEEGISFDHAPSGIDNISPILRQDQLNEQKFQILTNRIKSELDVDTIEISRDIALIVLVCQTPHCIHSVAAKAVKCLENALMSITVLSMSSNSISLTIGVEQKDLQNALRALYKELIA